MPGCTDTTGAVVYRTGDSFEELKGFILWARENRVAISHLEIDGISVDLVDQQLFTRDPLPLPHAESDPPPEHDPYPPDVLGSFAKSLKIPPPPSRGSDDA